MSQVTVRIPTPLRPLTGGADEVAVPLGTASATVNVVLESLGAEHPGLLPKLLKDGQLRSFVNLYLGDRNVKALGGLSTEVHSGDVLAIVPAVAGGRP